MEAVIYLIIYIDFTPVMDDTIPLSIQFKSELFKYPFKRKENLNEKRCLY